MSLRQDLRPAFTGVWLVISAVLMAAAVAPLLFPAEVLFGIFNECEARARGRECLLCGMTTAYVAIAAGDLSAARASNPGAIPLYIGSIVNFCAAATYMVMRTRRRWVS